MTTSPTRKAAQLIRKLAQLRKDLARRQAIRLKRRQTLDELRNRERELAEDLIERTLRPFFEDQIKTAAAALSKLGTTKAAGDGLANQLLNPIEWDEKLTDTLYPAMARIALAGIVSETKRMGLDQRKAWRKVGPSTVKLSGRIKASTATQLLENLGIDLSNIGTLETPYGPVSMGFLSEYPDWMKETIQDLLKETFDQPYWTEVNITTLGDIDQFIRSGVLEGWSIERMASEMAPRLLETGKYAKIRGRRIARTEAGHALNGARTAAIDSVIDELSGTGLPIRKMWHSVLGTTTRDSHAYLDGVAADADGKWFLGGVRCRWPGDVNLPASERCNCQCTITTGFGVDDEYAQQTISEYNDRIAKHARPKVKIFCPTGPGGGVDPRCRRGENYGVHGPGITGRTRPPKDEEDKGPKIPKFTPAKTIKEAEEWAKAQGIEHVHYSRKDGKPTTWASTENGDDLTNRLLNLDQINELHGALNELMPQYPKVKLEGLGTMFHIDHTVWKDNFEYHIANDKANYKGKRWRRTDAEKRVRKFMDPEPSVEKPNNPQKDYSIFISAQYGDKINIASGKSGKAIQWNHKALLATTTEQAERARAASLTKMAESMKEGKKPTGLSLVSDDQPSLAQHEFAHAIDSAYGIRKHPKMVQLHQSFSEADVKLGLSSYAATNIAEFIAEGFTEGLRKDARPMGVVIKKTIDSIVAEQKD
jgi:hypothetical protein